MEIYENSEFNEPEKPTRSRFLTFLCILTFIGSGFSFLSNLVMPFYKKLIPSMQISYSQLGDEATQKAMERLMNDALSVADWKFLLVSLTYALSVVGAYFMLKMKAVGFHLYVCAQILTYVCLNFLIKGAFAMQFVDVGWSVCFVVLYYIQLKEVLKTQEE